MTARTRWLDRLAAQVATLHARCVYRRFLEATRQAIRIQERVLLSKIRRNAGSDFGRAHHFERIRSYADFIAQVPIMSYEDFRPWIERVQAGDLRAMFGGRQQVLMFALTSGTLDRPKHIPVTRAFLNEYRRGWNAFGIKALLDHPEAMLRGIVQVTSRMDESRTSAGIPCGAITGLMAATQKRLVRKYYVTPQCLAEIDDPAAKYYTIMRLAVPADVGFCITASPATQLKLARTADEYKERLIREIHDGTLGTDLPVPSHVRDQLRGRLRPLPAAARRLEELVRRHGRLLPRHYWRLGFLANWTGGTMGLYLRDFPEYFGDTPVRDIGLLASEGRVTIPIEDGTPSGVLEVTSHFFEFLPPDRVNETNPRTCRCHELEPGQEYFVILTTSSGLYRYNLGDRVRVTGRLHQAPMLEFLSKEARVSSLAGEKLSEHQVVMAMEQVRRAGIPAPADFILAPRWADPPGYVLHIEATAIAPDDLQPGEHLAQALDAALGEVNIEYAGKRRSGRLSPVAVNILPPGTLAALDRQAAERYRRANEQYKHQYLYTDPRADIFSSVLPGTAGTPGSTLQPSCTDHDRLSV